MENRSERMGPRGAMKWGWGILVFVAALIALNGVIWFIVGPDMSISYTARVAGMRAGEFTGLYPQVAAHLARNARQVAVWYAAFGSMALLVGLEGLRHGTRWAWNAAWVVVAAPIAVGLIYLPGVEVSFDNVGLFTFGAIALLGQVLSRPR